MAREITRGRALANAALALAILALAALGIAQIARRHWQWQPTFTAKAQFSQISGLELGGKVHVQGMDAGVVQAIEPPAKPGGAVTVVMRLDERLSGLVRKDATASIQTQGVVGGRFVEITPGEADAPPLPSGGVLRSEAPIELADLMRDASAALKRVDAVAKSAETALAEINAIAANIRQGDGTLAKLIRDREAYDQMMALADRGQKALLGVEENLAALKGVWPISRYFNQRGFEDVDRALFQPGSIRESQILSDDELFVQGRAVLTVQGRRRLDQFADWFKGRNPASTAEIVVAAFTNDNTRGEDVARILTQEQAQSVRKYLMDRHNVQWAGWFSSRKVAAVGCGTAVPNFPDGPDPRRLPPRRVEIIVFTPQV